MCIEKRYYYTKCKHGGKIVSTVDQPNPARCPTADKKPDRYQCDGVNLKYETRAYKGVCCREDCGKAPHIAPGQFWPDGHQLSRTRTWFHRQREAFSFSRRCSFLRGCKGIKELGHECPGRRSVSIEEPHEEIERLRERLDAEYILPPNRVSGDTLGTDHSVGRSEREVEPKSRPNSWESVKTYETGASTRFSTAPVPPLSIPPVSYLPTASSTPAVSPAPPSTPRVAPATLAQESEGRSKSSDLPRSNPRTSIEEPRRGRSLDLNFLEDVSRMSPPDMMRILERLAYDAKAVAYNNAGVNINLEAMAHSYHMRNVVARADTPVTQSSSRPSSSLDAPGLTEGSSRNSSIELRRMIPQFPPPGLSRSRDEEFQTTFPGFVPLSSIGGSSMPRPTRPPRPAPAQPTPPQQAPVPELPATPQHDPASEFPTTPQNTPMPALPATPQHEPVPVLPTTPQHEPAEKPVPGEPAHFGYTYQ